MEVNIVRLIETQPLERLSQQTNAKLVSKLQETFTNEEQKLFLTSFWCYQNHKPDEFIINLDDVWKWLGFTRRDNAIRRIKSEKTELIENEDYIIRLLNTEERSGHNKETIILTINGFKDLCFLSRTKKGKEIRKYYVKLENITHEIFDEQNQKLQLELEKKEELNKQLIKRIKRRKKAKEKSGNCIYIVKDKNEPSYVKIGKTIDINHRLQSYNSASAEENIILHKHWLTRFNDVVEKLVLEAFHNFKYSVNNELIEIESLETLENFIDSLINILKPFEDDLEELEPDEPEENDPNFRICIKCNEELSIEEFYKSGNDNHQKSCKQCWKKDYEEQVKYVNKQECQQCLEWLPYKMYFKEETKENMKICSDCFKPNHRQCKTCHKILPTIEFSGLLSSCKTCHNEKRRQSIPYLICEFCNKEIKKNTLARHQKTFECRKAQGLEDDRPILRPDSKKVVKIDLQTGEILEQYISITDASVKNNITPSYISRVCHGNRKTGGGYAWKFVEN